MKNIKTCLSVNLATYFVILTFLLTGLIKNIILIYLIVVVHEFGHVCIIKYLGYKIKKIEIYPMGGVTTVEKKINTSVKQELLIASFGIVFQIILGFFFKMIISIGLISKGTYDLFLEYNKAIMLFNMLPIIPLDGYVFLRSFWELYLPYKKAFYVSLIFSIIVLGGFLIYNQVYAFNNYLIIGFLVYQIIENFRNFRYMYERFLLERYMYQFPYDNIRYEKKVDLGLLRKETLHFFEWKNTYIGEKYILNNKFKDNSLL